MDRAESSELLSVEVAYARPDVQLVLPLTVSAGTTAAQAIELSGILERFPEIDLSQQKIGIFGKLVSPDTALRTRDRVEIYRGLIADPKAARKQRAAQKQAAASDAQGEATEDSSEAGPKSE